MSDPANVRSIQNFVSKCSFPLSQFQIVFTQLVAHESAISGLLFYNVTCSASHVRAIFPWYFRINYDRRLRVLNVRVMILAYEEGRLAPFDYVINVLNGNNRRYSYLLGVNVA